MFKIFDWALDFSKKTGQKFPIFGICLGLHQLVAYDCYKNNVDPQKCVTRFPVWATNLSLIPSE